MAERHEAMRAPPLRVQTITEKVRADGGGGVALKLLQTP
jgi:hypothetical protein